MADPNQLRTASVVQSTAQKFPELACFARPSLATLPYCAGVQIGYWLLDAPEGNAHERCKGQLSGLTSSVGFSLAWHDMRRLDGCSEVANTREGQRRITGWGGRGIACCYGLAQHTGR